MRTHHLAAATVLAALCFNAQAAAGCKILPLAVLEKAMPEYTPWQASSENPNSCIFLSQAKTSAGNVAPALITISQEVKPSQEEAARVVTLMNEDLKSLYVTRKLVAKNTEGVFYWPKKDGQKNIRWVAHNGKTVSTGAVLIMDSKTPMDKTMSGIETITAAINR